jgi:hypothetical protein
VTGRYLTDLADVLRAAGIPVVEQDGWQSRARSSGGFADGRPWCVMWHHTASAPGADPASDAHYCSYTATDKPITNILLDRTGTAWICAAGATNTNGKGYAHTFSKGTVPDDSMNTYAIGVEIQNSGVGEQYPQVQIDAAFTISLALADAYGLQPTDALNHALWAPDRKIDPATAAAVQGPWKPRSTNSSGTWNFDDVLSELTARATAPLPPDPSPPTPLPLEEDDVPFLITNPDDGQIAVVYGVGLLVGLSGDEAPHWIDRFGEPLPAGTSSGTWPAFVSKQPT